MPGVTCGAFLGGLPWLRLDPPEVDCMVMRPSQAPQFVYLGNGTFLSQLFAEQPTTPPLL
jgi:hypothetical protein